MNIHVHPLLYLPQPIGCVNNIFHPFHRKSPSFWCATIIKLGHRSCPTSGGSRGESSEVVLFGDCLVDTAGFVRCQTRGRSTRLIIEAFTEENRVRTRGEQEDNVACAAKPINTNHSHGRRCADVTLPPPSLLHEADPTHNAQRKNENGINDRVSVQMDQNESAVG
jgi:hypothetical protein